MELRIRYVFSFLAALLSSIVAIAIGYASGRDWPYTACFLTVVEILPLLAFCWLLPIEFGPSGLSRNQVLLHLILVTVLLLVGGAPLGFQYQIAHTREHQVAMGVIGTALSGLCIAIFGGRPIYLAGALIAVPRGLQGTLLPNYADTPDYIPWYGWVLSSYFFVTSFVRYKKDQSTLGMLTIAVGSCIPYGHSLATSPSDSHVFLIVMAFFAYAQVLWMRRGRRFPPGLTGCKFVTLEYIRRVAATGEGIKRCQDLPPDAFGEPRKARFVISVSHRWLKQYSCDVKSEEYPEGMRLHTMVAALDEYFSVRGIWKGSGFWDRLQRLTMALTGGRDVLLFFDFMCLPQETLAADGSIQTRSPHEQLLFSRCLPNMGALYSMLPVLVCEDVPEGVRAYMDSGWCFAEVSTAWLGNQLEPYSTHCRAAWWFRRVTFSNQDNPALFAQALDSELKHKHFLRERDREEVRNIIRNFHMKSCLVTALKSRSKSDLDDILTDPSFRAFGLLDQAVDSDLNTPLHLAVAHNFPDGVKKLLESGARRDLRNLRGDLPVNWFMIPRLSRAAFVCRKYVIMKNFEVTLDAVRKSSCRSNSKSIDACEATSATAGKEVISFGKETTIQSGMNGADSIFYSSAASFYVSQPSNLDADLEQPKATSAVEFSGWSEYGDLNSTALSPQTSRFASEPPPPALSEYKFDEPPHTLGEPAATTPTATAKEPWNYTFRPEFSSSPCRPGSPISRIFSGSDLDSTDLSADPIYVGLPHEKADFEDECPAKVSI